MGQVMGLMFMGWVGSGFHLEITEGNGLDLIQTFVGVGLQIGSGKNSELLYTICY